VKPAPFEYHAPATAEEAVTLLRDLGDDAKVIAGGQSLVPMLALRLARFEHLVDIARIAELNGISRHNGTLTVRATTTDAVVERDPTVAESVPLLTKVTPMIGHFQIRNRGTLGGSLAHADPAAEYPAVARALDATFDVVSADGHRTVSAADFFDGIWSTSMRPDEILTAVSFPVWEGRCGHGAAEFARRHGDFAIAGAVASVCLGSGGAVERAAIALFGLGSVPVRAGAAEQAVTGRQPSEIAAAEVGELAMADAGEPPDDLNGSSSYRLRVGAAMAAKAWTEAIEEAQRA
jgi:aerobic carbon-monoxide dehydrogenase medium subunit